MSDGRVFPKSVASLPPSVVLANPRISRAVSAGLEEVDAKLEDGRAIMGVLAEPQGQAAGGIGLFHESWGFDDKSCSVRTVSPSTGEPQLWSS